MVPFNVKQKRQQTELKKKKMVPFNVKQKRQQTELKKTTTTKKNH